MYTLDAGIAGRDLDTTDQEYVVCHDLIVRLKQEDVPIIVPRLLLAELAGLVRRVTGDAIRARLAVEAWSSFPNIQLIPLTESLLAAAAEIAADYALRGADATYVAVARAYNLGLSLDSNESLLGIIFCQRSWQKIIPKKKKYHAAVYPEE